MIGRLSGTLLEKQPPLLLIDVMGVGYEVFSPMSTFYHLPDIQGQVSLFIHHLLRADSQTLYGFLKKQERQLFRTLLKVQAVGPKVALSILSSITPAEFTSCVECNDSKKLTHIPGVGPRTAERLVMELRNVLPAIQHVPSANSTHHAAWQEAISALTALGYKEQEASRMLSQVDLEAQDVQASEQLIRLALKKRMEKQSNA